jgi:predicted TIM-barrel fold metal-dependent hydrolase
MKVPGVPREELVGLARAFPGAAVVALCAYFREAVELASASPNLHVDLAFMEAADTLAAALREIPARQILFGSYTPLLYTEGALMKLRLAAAGTRERRLVASGNATRLLK